MPMAISMRRFIACFLFGLLTATSAPAQDGARATETSAINSPPPAHSSADEIAELKASLQSLRIRLDELTASQPDVLRQRAADQITSDSKHGQSSDDFQAFRLLWHHGLFVESRDENFRAHVGGNIQIDNGWNKADTAVQYGPGGIGNLQDGAVFRRARIRIEGTLYKHFDWLAEFDFANSVENDTSSNTQTIGTPSFTNVWLDVKELPYLGTIRAGWMTEPFGLENYTSNRWLPFMERMPGNPLFTSPGVMLINYGPDERATFATGVFHAQDNNFGFGYGDGERVYTTRVTGLPWYDCDGEQLLHLGFDFSHRHLDNDQERLSGRPSVRTMPSTNLPFLANTGTITGTTEDLLDFELAGVYGPWMFQSEYYTRWIHDVVYPSNSSGLPLGTLFYQGGYFEVLYFLTGEHQPYNRKTGTFDRVIPNTDFNPWDAPHGWGAWQVGIRYAYLDLQNKGVSGATLNDFTFGLNWYLNPQAKVQWNLAIDHRESTPPGSDGWTYIFGLRLALDF